MRTLQIIVMLIVSAIALTFLWMPIHWCEVPHRRHLGAWIAWLVFLAYLVVSGPGNTNVTETSRVLVGVLCGVALATIFASGPLGFALSICTGAALGKFGLDWAA